MEGIITFIVWLVVYQWVFDWLKLKVIYWDLVKKSESVGGGVVGYGWLKWRYRTKFLVGDIVSRIISGFFVYWMYTIMV